MRDTMTAYWSKELAITLVAPVAFEPPAAQVAPACRSGLDSYIALYCEPDRTIVIGPGLATESRRFGADFDYGSASVLAHEVAHRVQAAVHQPGFTTESAANPKLEQQADCLSGAWAAYEYRNGKLDTTRFLAVTKQQLLDVSDNPEIYTHGTPQVRFAAVSRGVDGGKTACGLGRPL